MGLLDSLVHINIANLDSQTDSYQMRIYVSMYQHTLVSDEVSDEWVDEEVVSPVEEIVALLMLMLFRV